MEKGLREHFRDTSCGSGSDKAKIARETLGSENDVREMINAHSWREILTNGTLRIHQWAGEAITGIGEAHTNFGKAINNAILFLHEKSFLQ